MSSRGDQCSLKYQGEIYYCRFFFRLSTTQFSVIEAQLRLVSETTSDTKSIDELIFIFNLLIGNSIDMEMEQGAGTAIKCCGVQQVERLNILNSRCREPQVAKTAEY